MEGLPRCPGTREPPMPRPLVHRASRGSLSLPFQQAGSQCSQPWGAPSLSLVGGGSGASLPTQDRPRGAQSGHTAVFPSYAQTRGPCEARAVTHSSQGGFSCFVGYMEIMTLLPCGGGFRGHVSELLSTWPGTQQARDKHQLLSSSERSDFRHFLDPSRGLPYVLNP